MRDDQLIGLAFAGRRADAIPEEDPAEPPPMSRGSFLAWVTFWVEKAVGSCDLNGTITITETLTGSRTLTQAAPPGSLSWDLAPFQGNKRGGGVPRCPRALPWAGFRQPFRLKPGASMCGVGLKGR